MNLFLASIALAIFLGIVVWLVFKFIMWTQSLEDKEIKGE